MAKFIFLEIGINQNYHYNENYHLSSHKILQLYEIPDLHMNRCEHDSGAKL